MDDTASVIHIDGHFSFRNHMYTLNPDSLMFAIFGKDSVIYIACHFYFRNHMYTLSPPNPALHYGET